MLFCHFYTYLIIWLDVIFWITTKFVAPLFFSTYCCVRYLILKSCGPFMDKFFFNKYILFIVSIFSGMYYSFHQMFSLFINASVSFRLLYCFLSGFVFSLELEEVFHEKRSHICYKLEKWNDMIPFQCLSQHFTFSNIK